MSIHATHLTYSARSEELVVFQVKPNTQVAYAPRASDEFPRVLLYRPRCGRHQRFCRQTSKIRSDLILEVLQPMANVVCPSASTKIHPASWPFRARHIPPCENRKQYSTFRRTPSNRQGACSFRPHSATRRGRRGYFARRVTEWKRATYQIRPRPFPTSSPLEART